MVNFTRKMGLAAAIMLTYTMFAGVYQAGAKAFYTHWGVNADTIKALMPAPPYDDFMQLGSHGLEFMTEVDGQPAQVLYGFINDKLYVSVYSFQVWLDDFSEQTAYTFRDRLDGLVLAQLERPRYMLAPWLQDFAGELNWISRFLDAKLSVTSICALEPEEQRLHYMVVFMDATHSEAAGDIAAFEDYWQGKLSDVPFIDKQDLGIR